MYVLDFLRAAGGGGKRWKIVFHFHIEMHEWFGESQDAGFFFCYSSSSSVSPPCFFALECHA
jgi:hypothetical protein